MKDEQKSRTKAPVYAVEFKQSAVELVLKEGLSRAEVGRRLGVPSKAVGRWVKAYQADAERAFPGKGNPRDEELHKLRKELRQMRMERDILKKAVGIFSEMPTS